MGGGVSSEPAPGQGAGTGAHHSEVEAQAGPKAVEGAGPKDAGEGTPVNWEEAVRGEDMPMQHGSYCRIFPLQEGSPEQEKLATLLLSAQGNTSLMTRGTGKDREREKEREKQREAKEKEKANKNKVAFR